MDTAQIETGTAIALPAPIKLEAILKERAATDDLLKQIVAAGDAEFSALSADTKNGRTALIALSNKASTTRAEAKRHRLALTEQWRSDTAAVNACGKVLDDGLAAARDKWRAPVTAWEEMEAARIQRLKDRLAAIDAGRADALCPSGQIAAVLFEIEAIEIGADWAEYREIAEAKRKTVIGALQGNLAAARDREAQQAELAQLRAEAAARAEADHIREAKEAAKRRSEAEEADRKRAAEAKAEADRIAAERAEASRLDLVRRLKAYFKECESGFIGGQPQPYQILLHDMEVRVLVDMAATGESQPELEALRQKTVMAIKASQSEHMAARLAQIERDKAEAAERARVEAEQRAAKEKADAEARHQREIAEAEARTAAALQAERDRIAAEAKAKADADAYRAADEAHRAEVLGDIEAALSAMAGNATPAAIAAALMAGKIPHVKVLL